MISMEVRKVQNIVVRILVHVESISKSKARKAPNFLVVRLGLT
jgi:hypothetical protein